MRAQRHGSGRRGTAGGGAAPLLLLCCCGSAGGGADVDAAGGVAQSAGMSSESSGARSHTRMSLSDEPVTRTLSEGTTRSVLTKSTWPTVVERSVLVCGRA